MSAARYKENDEVFTPEGLSGKVIGQPVWNADTEEFDYSVKWDDGVEDVQGEGFLDLDGDEWLL